MDTTNWKHFRMDKIFHTFERGKVHSQNTLSAGKDYFYVGAKKGGCGVMERCGYDKDLVSKGNCVIFICNGEGSVGYCNYMDRDFMASGDLILAYGDKINPYTALFIVTLLDRERPKYSFGRKYGKYVKTTAIPLPVGVDGINPDWQYIEGFVKKTIIPKLPRKAKNVWQKKYDNKPTQAAKIHFNTKEWKWFRHDAIFTEISVAKSFDLNSLEIVQDGINYLSRTVENNGYECKVKYDAEKITKGGFISVVMVGIPASAFYQEKDVICSQNILVLRYPQINVYNALFILTLLQLERYRFSYGRTLSKTNFVGGYIKLPVTSDGLPNWQFMEDYIKSLPYSKNI